MVRPRLTLKFLGKVFGALVFIAAGVGALSGCNGVPGDGRRRRPRAAGGRGHGGRRASGARGE